MLVLQQRLRIKEMIQLEEEKQKEARKRRLEKEKQEKEKQEEQLRQQLEKEKVAEEKKVCPRVHVLPLSDRELETAGSIFSPLPSVLFPSCFANLGHKKRAADGQISHSAVEASLLVSVALK